MESRSFEGVVRYHEQTKHHFHRFAKSLGYMDWDNQPNPFRTYEGVEIIRLPLLKSDPPAGYDDLYTRRDNQSRPFVLEQVAGFLELSLGLSAWKSIPGSQWSLRINPSSGNLHPTESHLILPPMDTREAGVFHYNPLAHALERRAVVPGDLWRKVVTHKGFEGFLVALSSIFWRESWKYGERGFRYCNHDVGHALACLSLSASIQGWKVKCLNGLSDEEVQRALGFHEVEWVEEEEEHPEILCFVHSSEAPDVPRRLPPDIVSALSGLHFSGKPNVLSRDTYRWEAIGEVALHASKPVTPEKKYRYGAKEPRGSTAPAPGASRIIRQRRSAVAFSGRGSLTRNQFLSILERTLPRDDRPPFDVELMEPCIHLLLFVHNVLELEQGLYFLVRNADHMAEIQSVSNPVLQWRKVDEDLPLFFLQAGDFRRTATRVSCDQEIAGESIFSLGMIARFRETLREEPYRYRHLFWESGMVGQVLYLEAEAHGVRGTGMGCFYDDPVHEIMGFKDNAYQSLYHFTIGEPVEDRRLGYHPPYAHLKPQRL